MEDALVMVAIGILKGITLVYDLVCFIPSRIIQRPKKRTTVSDRIKALPVVSGDPATPFRTVDSFTRLTTTPIEGCDTVDDLFTHAVRQYPERDCLGTRELLSEEDEIQPNGKVFKKVILGHYNWQTYEEVHTRLTNFGSGVLSLGQQPRQNIVIFAETRAEWMISLQACLKYNFPVATLYATLGDEAVVMGINETEVSFVITSSELLPKIKILLPKMPLVRRVIYMEGQKRPNLDGFPDNVKVHSMHQVEQIGAKPENIHTPVTKPSREDIAVIMYTSGSTGKPKGVLITHGNLMCGMSGQCQRVPSLGPKDTYIGYLPLAHVLELAAELSCMGHGTRIGYSSPQTLSDQSTKIKKGSKGDATVLRPTLMAAVPVIMDRLYKSVWEKVNESSKFMQAFFRFAYERKKDKLERGLETPIFNRLVFKKIRGILGGRVRMMLSGGAPLSQDTQRFMNICFCCPVGQGYGLTETAGAGTVQETSDISTGRVGHPLQCNEILLVNWKEGGYETSDEPNPRGEILVGGGNVAMGYYKMPEKTAEDFREMDGQRWFCTGDIGEIEPDGSLKIIDRKKDLVKLQTGEYISLSKIETALKMNALIDNCCIYADSFRMFSICLVVPNVKALKALAERIELNGTDIGILCKMKEVETEVLKVINEQAKKAKLEKYEVPQRVALCSEPWTADKGLLTEAFKLRRRNIQTEFQTDIDHMYA